MHKEVYKDKYVRMITDHFGNMLTDEDGKVVGVPSMVSFSKSIGVSIKAIELWRRCHDDFNNACLECGERQKQLIIDAALSKKVDSSFAKYYLSSMFSFGEGDDDLSESDRELIENALRRSEKESIG